MDVFRFALFLLQWAYGFHINSVSFVTWTLQILDKRLNIFKAFRKILEMFIGKVFRIRLHKFSLHAEDIAHNEILYNGENITKTAVES